MRNSQLSKSKSTRGKLNPIPKKVFHKPKTSLKTETIKNRPSTVSIQNELCSDTLSLRGGVYIAKWSFFYTNGKSAQYFQEKVESAFPNACVIDSGKHWHSFCGGAKTGSSKYSYFWVTFRI